MNYIVFDLEWNQCPGGKSRENPRLPFEIIEIGAVKLDKNMREVGEFHEVVRPLVYHHLHYRMKEVVPITEAELNKARTFSRVVREFLKWIGDEEFRFVTWGGLDVLELQRNMDYYRIPNPFPKPLLYYDLQKLYSLLYDDGKKRLALDAAIEREHIACDRPFHRANDDAWYTAQVMKGMDFKAVSVYESVDYYRLPSTREEEIFLDFGTYTKYVSRPFASRDEAMADKTVTSLKCCKCKLPTWKRVKWFSTGTSVYLGLSQCPKHGYVKGKLRLKKLPNGTMFVVKTIKLADDEAARSIRDKREQMREHRRNHRKSKKGQSPED